MSADWRRLLAGPAFLGDLYEGLPPGIGDCDLFYCHIDERGNSVTLGFDTRVFPDKAPADWLEGNLNSFEFYVVFDEVWGVAVTGWGAAESRNLSLTATDDGLELRLGTAESGITFRARRAALSSKRPYLRAGSD